MNLEHFYTDTSETISEIKGIQDGDIEIRSNEIRKLNYSGQIIERVAKSKTVIIHGVCQNQVFEVEITGDFKVNYRNLTKEINGLDEFKEE